MSGTGTKRKSNKSNAQREDATNPVASPSLLPATPGLQRAKLLANERQKRAYTKTKTKTGLTGLKATAVTNRFLASPVRVRAADAILTYGPMTLERMVILKVAGSVWEAERRLLVPWFSYHRGEFDLTAVGRDARAGVRPRATPGRRLPDPSDPVTASGAGRRKSGKKRVAVGSEGE